MSGGSSSWTNHPGLDWLRGSPEGRAWLARLPELTRECVQRWGLELGEPFSYAFESLAIPATRAGGSPAVLKIQYPGPENEHEAAALAHWDGRGAVRLLDHDPDRRALLLEHCRPGTPLHDIGLEAALDVAVELLPRLWITAGAPFRPLAEEAADWAEGLPELWQKAGEPFDRFLLAAAVEALETLAGTQGDAVLLHQDLHADNILRAEREPWLVIDPKPLAGEREFGVVALIRGAELGHSREAVLRRLDRLTSGLGLDRDRTRRWAMAQSIAWAFDGSRVLRGHLEVANWLMDAG